MYLGASSSAPITISLTYSEAYGYLSMPVAKLVLAILSAFLTSALGILWFSCDLFAVSGSSMSCTSGIAERTNFIYAAHSSLVTVVVSFCSSW